MVLQVLQTESVGVVGHVQFVVEQVLAGSGTLLSMLDTIAPFTAIGACGLSVEHEFGTFSGYLGRTIIVTGDHYSRIVERAWE